jgi:hypothetical protein
MTRILNITILLLCLCGAAHAADEFQAVKCGTDIAAALKGRHMSKERVAVAERRHKDIGLKDLGGSEISDALFLESWLICGNEYELLVDPHEIVRDVLLLPYHSKTSPEFEGRCRVNNQETPEAIIAVLEDEAEHKSLSIQGKNFLKAKFAWKIDESQAKFVKMNTDGLRCPEEGIISLNIAR